MPVLAAQHGLQATALRYAPRLKPTVGPLTLIRAGVRPGIYLKEIIQ